MRETRPIEETVETKPPSRSSAGIVAVLFDLDGVLIDSYEVWYQLLNAAASDLGYPAIPREVFHGCWGQGLQADRDTFFVDHSLEQVGAYFDAHFPDHVQHLKVSPHAPTVFSALRQKRLPCAVITNTSAELARDLVARAGATPDIVVGGDDVPNAKPAPDMVWRACERLSVDPSRALVVGDSRYDREAARAAGARFAGLGIEGDLTLASLDELLEHL